MTVIDMFHSLPKSEQEDFEALLAKYKLPRHDFVVAFKTTYSSAQGGPVGRFVRVNRISTNREVAFDDGSTWILNLEHAIATGGFN